MRDGKVPKNLYVFKKYRSDFFEKLLLRITPLHEFNDPFEGVLSKKSYEYLLNNGSFRTEKERINAIKDFERDWEEYGAQSRIEKWGVICLTEKKDCLIMWAHYANEHKGILVEFDTTGGTSNTHPFFEGEIDESKNTPEILKIKANPVIYNVDNKRPDHLVKTIQEMYMRIIYSAFSKSKEWEYEKEYRMMMNFTEVADEVINSMYFKKIPEETISKIYIGCRAENKKQIIEDFSRAKSNNPKLNHVKLYESILDNDLYKVNYREI